MHNSSVLIQSEAYCRIKSECFIALSSGLHDTQTNCIVGGYEVSMKAFMSRTSAGLPDLISLSWKNVFEFDINRERLAELMQGLS